MSDRSDPVPPCTVRAALPDPAPAAVLVGLSGGLDSSVLLHALSQRPQYRSAGLRALHVHHGLHADADAWAEHCAAVCAALAIPLQVLRVQVPRDSGLGLEAAARQARRAAFAQALAAGEWLALAQHRDDQAETFLLRALRASGPDALAAMQGLRPFADGMLWRPLLALPRGDLHAYALRHALRWIEDPSNADPGFDRNFLRLHVLPLLRQRWPQADAALARSAQLCGEAGALLDDGDQAALEAARDGAAASLSLPRLRALPAPRRARVLRRWVAQAGLPPLPAAGLAAIERDLLHARADASAQFAWHGATLRCWRDALYAERDPPPLPADWHAHWDGRAPLALPDGRHLRLLADAPLGFDAPLRVRLRQGGERILLPGRAHSQALKQVLQDRAVPPWQRARLPLLFDAERLQAAGADILAAPLHAWLQAHGARLALDAAATPSSPASH
ncbi:tRNA lysidine(34) synthetase TilS [Xanthomonas sp. AM6]|uniref:tRNA lysidine(34) synthetase TilS n=1 Tax=Xanthomonas sp. AM6 TaxID=2982531 RepID=UPI0021D878EA|nr:tRNA lysidine(34) synthetase TilS [Xanthomonas sp. AM6]UYB50959.1 tRNA lysidine(34) synthetase TilS [Xanthomonas sp. AM6]